MDLHIFTENFSKNFFQVNWEIFSGELGNQLQGKQQRCISTLRRSGGNFQVGSRLSSFGVNLTLEQWFGGILPYRKNSDIVF